MRIVVFSLENGESILSTLRKSFPDIGFLEYDRSLDLEEEGPDLLAIGTVRGVDSVCLIDDLDSISPGRALSGSEMLMTLRIMLKIGSLKSVRVFAVPEGCPEADAAAGLSALIRDES